MLAVIGIGLMGFFSLKMGKIGHAFNDIPSFIGYISLSVIVFRICAQFLPCLKQAFIKVGDISYFLYLTHVLVLTVLIDVVHLFGKNLTPIYLVVFLPLAFLFALLFQFVYTSIEGQLRQKASASSA